MDGEAAVFATAGVAGGVDDVRGRSTSDLGREGGREGGKDGEAAAGVAGRADNVRGRSTRDLEGGREGGREKDANEEKGGMHACMNKISKERKGGVKPLPVPRAPPCPYQSSPRHSPPAAQSPRDMPTMVME